MTSHYSILIQWSETDQLYWATVPEFVGRVKQPCSSGSTYTDAMHEAEDCIYTCLEVWDENGEDPPPVKALAIAG
jgi:predicted RNase H-like HicB family nuclease